ncbi:hypothetical protein [Rummeliibacillus pycnus]|uniref:hypothetical protein n=1 Tax=Rummeliibacillus pycnus TaxID=101070 RepID=UPI0037CAC796
MRMILDNLYFKLILILIVTCTVSIYSYTNANLYQNINGLKQYSVYSLIILIIAGILLFSKTNSLNIKILYWVLMLLSIGCLIIYNYEKPEYTYKEAVNLIKDKENLDIINKPQINMHTKKDNQLYEIYKIVGKSKGTVKTFSFDPYTGEIYEIK